MCGLAVASTTRQMEPILHGLLRSRTQVQEHGVFVFAHAATATARRNRHETARTARGHRSRSGIGALIDAPPTRPARGRCTSSRESNVFADLDTLTAEVAHPRLDWRGGRGWRVKTRGAAQHCRVAVRTTRLNPAKAVADAVRRTSQTVDYNSLQSHALIVSALCPNALLRGRVFDCRSISLRSSGPDRDRPYTVRVTPPKVPSRRGNQALTV